MEHLSGEAWSRINTLLDTVWNLEPEERSEFLDEACAEKPELREYVEALLRAEAEAPDFLEGEAASFAGEALAGMMVEGEPLSGQRVGPYRLDEEVGRGGMSRVYRATRADGAFEQEVAVKLLRIGFDSEEARQRFRLERQVLATLQHPNIARLLDGGLTEDGVPYLVMEHVEGQPITTYCDERQLPIRERLALLITVSEALQYAHQNLVVHRDLKPSNILVTDDGAVKLLDFGIAKLLDTEAAPLTVPATRTGVRPMTPAYAAPEQVRGEAVSTATDVYQLGVLAYELLTGHRPFESIADNRFEVERAVLEEEPTRPSTVVTMKAERDAKHVTPEAVGEARRVPVDQLRRRLRGDLDAVVLKALRKDADQRYASAEAFVTDIERYLNGRPVEARSLTLDYRARKFAQRHRWGVGVAVAFLVVIAVSGVILVRQRAVAERQRDRAQAEAEAATQVSDFLVSLFEASNPFASEEKTLSARDLLRRGQERVEALEGQPVVQSRVFDAMGRAYRGLGNYERADSLLRRALTLRRRVYGDDHLAVAKTLAHLGDLRRAEYLSNEALAYYRKAFSIFQNRDGPLSRSDSLLKANVLSDLSRALRNTGKPDSAETLMRQALTLRQAVQGSDHPDVWATKSDLAYVLRESGSVDEAERLYRDVLEWQREHADSLKVAHTLNNLGYLLRTRGKLAQAERRYREALRIHEDALGPTHPITLMIRGNNLGTLYMMQDDLAAAEKILRKQLRAVRAHYPDDHWRVGKWAYILGERLLLRERHLAEAEALLREGVRIYRASDVASRESVLEIQAILGHCLVLRNKDRRAKPLLQESRAVLSADSVDAPRDLAHAEIGLGIYHTRRGHYARAESLLTKAHATFETIFNDAPGVNQSLRPVRQVRSRLANLYEVWGKPEKAARYRVK